MGERQARSSGRTGSRLLGIAAFLALGAVIVGGTAAAAGGRPTGGRAATVAVTTDRTVYGGGPVRVVITNGLRQAIVLPNCGGVQLERFDGEAWASAPAAPCPGELEEIRVAPGASREVEVAVAASSRTLFRPVVTYALGCRAGQAVAFAECAQVDGARGRYFSWAPAPGAAP